MSSKVHPELKDKEYVWHLSKEIDSSQSQLEELEFPDPPVCSPAYDICYKFSSLFQSLSPYLFSHCMYVFV